MTLALHYALRSDVGLLREGNEDSAYAGPRLLAIADGMGGHAAGEVASAVAISAIAPLDRQDLTDSDAMLDALAAAVSSARNTLHDMSISDPAVEGMGTTLTALLWAGAQVAVCHIGDSRAYLLRDGDLYQITRDHTLIQSLVDEGRLSPAAAANHPQRSLIMRALQGSTDADPDLAMHKALVGDRYLLCSDGLTDVVGDEAVHGVLSTVPDADQAVNQLIALAIRNGGPDNITCIVADVIDPEVGPERPTVETMLAGAASNGDVSTLLQAATGRAAAAGSDMTPAAPGASLNGHGAGAVASVADDEADEDDDFGVPRRRWPVVTTVLIVLLAVVAGGLYAGYRATQGNYYLASDGSQISIYRGINQTIGWINLSHVYRKTEVPLSHVPGDLSMPTTPTTLPKTLTTLASINHAYTCTQAEKALETWQARYGHRTSTTKTVTTKTGAKKTITIPPPPAPAKPKVPASCPAQGAG
ncbi:MAG TPA: protein phosphatase 2C domain-containing protein [Streptosporangiaceae bacterium]|nr:protein phosphatase 2C domain-containing protein [Streptosporangiaceae bacterium]